MTFSPRNILCFTFTLICIYCRAQEKEYTLSTIAFYNLENLFDPADDPYKSDEEFTPEGANHYTEAIYRKKLHNMAYVLSQLAIDKNADGPSLIGLAEVENDKVLQDLVTEPELKDRKLKTVHFESPDNRGIDVALLYHPKYFKVLQAKALPVELMNNGKRERTRDVLYVLGLLNKDTVHVFVNHWPSRRTGEDGSAWKRTKAAAVTKKIMEEIVKKNPDVHCIIMGDLNDDPIDESVTKTLGAIGNRHEVERGGLYNPWVAFYKKGLGTLSFEGHWHLFDQIIISSGFIAEKSQGWTFYKAEIFGPTFLKHPFGRQKGYPHRSFSGYRWVDGYSDHFPVILYLRKQQVR